MLFDSEFLAKLEHLYLLSQRIFRGTHRAERRSHHAGSSLEFADYRNYVPGDDPRSIDWNVYGRLDRLFVKLFEAEEDLAVYVLVDCSASMGWTPSVPRLRLPRKQRRTADGQESPPPAGPGVSKFDQARKIAAALAYIALANLDRVNVHGFDDRLGSDCGLSRGKSQFHKILRFLSDLQYSNRTTALEASLRTFSQRVKRRGLAILISDFFDPAGFRDALNLLRFQRFEIELIQVLHPGELRPDLSGDFELVDAETGSSLEVTATQAVRAAVAKEMEDFLADLQRYSVEYRIGSLIARTDVPFEDLVLRVLRERRFAA
jgi:uncharacterized protein (DUF58 family)